MTSERRGSDRRPWLEPAVLVLLSAVVVLILHRKIIADPAVFQPDAIIHTYWMRRFRDASLFTDPVTQALLGAGQVPAGVRAFYWTASRVIDPVTLGEWLAVALAPFCTWLVFRIIRDHTEWMPAAWLGAGFYLFAWDVQSFNGGHARGLHAPIVLLTVLFALRGRHWLAMIVASVGVLFYPPATLGALAILAFASLGWDERRRPVIDRKRALAVVAGGAAAVAGYLVVTRIGHVSNDPLTREIARGLPEFGVKGVYQYFVPSLTRFFKQPLSGFHLLRGGSMLAVLAFAVIAFRPRNARLIPKEVWAIALASVATFGVTHLAAFRLYIPQRQTAPLIPFFAIVIALAWRPTWEAVAVRLGGRTGALAAAAVVGAALLVYVAWTAFPLGPGRSVTSSVTFLWEHAVVVGLVLAVGAAGFAVFRYSRPHDLSRATVAAVLAGVLAMSLVAAGGMVVNTKTCSHPRLYRYLSTLPASAVIAAEPHSDAECIPIAARRPVVMSLKLYQPWELTYLRFSRPRLFRMIDAYYGDSTGDILRLRRLYGADYLVVRAVTPPWGNLRPFTTRVARHLFTLKRHASLELGSRCRTFAGDGSVYDLACLNDG